MIVVVVVVVPSLDLISANPANSVCLLGCGGVRALLQFLRQAASLTCPYCFSSSICAYPTSSSTSSPLCNHLLAFSPLSSSSSWFSSPTPPSSFNVEFAVALARYSGPATSSSSAPSSPSSALEPALLLARYADQVLRYITATLTRVDARIPRTYFEILFSYPNALPSVRSLLLRSLIDFTAHFRMCGVDMELASSKGGSGGGATSDSGTPSVRFLPRLLKLLRTLLKRLMFVVCFHILTFPTCFPSFRSFLSFFSSFLSCSFLSVVKIPSEQHVVFLLCFIESVPLAMGAQVMMRIQNLIFSLTLNWMMMTMKASRLQFVFMILLLIPHFLIVEIVGVVM